MAVIYSYIDCIIEIIIVVVRYDEYSYQVEITIYLLPLAPMSNKHTRNNNNIYIYKQRNK